MCYRLLVYRIGFGIYCGATAVGRKFVVLLHVALEDLATPIPP